jgi:uncharacterized protein (TIGR03067 family)
MTACLLVLASMLPADATAPPDGPPTPREAEQEDFTDFQGEWDVVAFQFDGKDYFPTCKDIGWAFDRNTVYQRTPVGAIARTVRLGHSTWPTIDVTDLNKGYVSRGVYLRVGDVLFWSTTWDDGGKSGGRRPTEFDSKADSGVALWTLRRVRK